jgi:Putative phage metallopeptidase
LPQNNPDKLAITKNAAKKSMLHQVLQRQEFCNFLSLKFKLIFCLETQSSKGRGILASIHLPQKRDALLHDFNAIILIDKFYWHGHENKRAPLLYHELCHLAWDEDTNKLITVGHDIEDFLKVYRRYGDWQKDIEKINVAHLQLQLELVQHEA